jgi:murein L,D-transpeptidase YcbB/YkuD
MRIPASKITAGLLCGGLALLTTASVVAAPALPEASAPVTAQPIMQPVSHHLWSIETIRDLQAEALAAGDEGLDPQAYDVAAVAAAAAFGESAAADQAATRTALALARDYAQGRVTDKRRFDWHIETPTDLNALTGELYAAIREKRLRPWLRSLLPQDARYAALRHAYVTTPADDRATRDRLRANLERWRWMPRDLGSDHIFVNVPSYTLDVVDEGRPVSTYTVVVGKPSTPTPQIAVEAQSIVVNPWWNVPRSISKKMSPSAARGFLTSPDGGLRQRPGPGNALGKVKIDMPNPHSIYLHDTPSKALFAKPSRAFSHGCIRVKDIERLAAELAALDDGNEKAVRQAIAGSVTRTLRLTNKRPVYLVYFTAQVGPDGSVQALEDPYGRDRRVIEALDGATRLAAKGQSGGRS